MEGKSKYALVVLALSLGFAMFCAGRFSARVTSAQPWQVTAARLPQESDAAFLPDSSGEEGYPESLLPGEVIDVNTADVYDLQRLPGVGEKRARDIIAYREEHGPFQTVDELDSVPGIGPKILEGLKAYAAAG